MTTLMSYFSQDSTLSYELKGGLVVPGNGEKQTNKSILL